VAGAINSIRADPCSFMGAYEFVEKYMVAYRSGMWVRTYDAWVLWKGHGMVWMLLTGHTVCICQYWMYERGQERMFLAWG
jgi:hypothetical protein